MIKIDASNFIPKRLGTYLLGVIPGAFFEMTMAFGDPALAHKLVDRVRQIYPFEGYALLVLFLVSCLLVGQTFYFLAWFVDWTIDFIYRRLWSFIFLTLGSNWLYKAVGRWQGMPPKPSARHVWRVVMWARKKKIPFEIRPILICQRRAALELLRRKYGVKLSKRPSPSVDEEWQAWLAVLGKAPPGLRESFLLMRVSLACGLGELAALYLCAALRNRYFATMCGTLLLAGVFQVLNFLQNRNAPARRSLATLAMIVEELAELSPTTLERKTQLGYDSSLRLKEEASYVDTDSE